MVGYACRKCGDDLEVGVNWTPGMARYYNCLCSKCVGAKNKAYRDEHREDIKAYKEQYRAEHKEQRRAAIVRKTQGRRAVLSRYKRMRGCMLCGENRSACLEFHHNTDKKNENVSVMLSSYSWTRIKAEVALCVVLCANCHKLLHAGELTLSSQEGVKQC